MSIVLSLAAVLVSLSASPRTESGLDAILADHAYAVEIENSRIVGGPGADLLENRVGSALYFLVGENHGNRESPYLVEALLGVAREAGYRHFGLEVGPHGAIELTRLLAADGRWDAFREFFETYPFSIAFFDWEEEIEMVIEAHDLGFELWGLDQEFAASPGHLLDRLAEHLDDQDEARRLVEIARIERDRFRDPARRSEGFLMTVTTAELDRIGSLVPTDDRAGRALVNGLRESAAIYQLWAGGANYESNVRRVALMKRQLVEHLRASALEKTSPPKVLFKFGAVHMGRGRSAVDQFDLGNLLSEHAILEGGRSFHLRVTATSVASVGGPTVDLVASTPWLAPLASVLGDRDAVLFDLEPLRPFFHDADNRALNAALADLAFAYDAVLVYRSFVPSRSITGG